MNNQRAIDRLTKHLEWGWSKKTVDAIEMGIHALKETQWIPSSASEICRSNRLAGKEVWKAGRTLAGNAT